MDSTRSKDSNESFELVIDLVPSESILFLIQFQSICSAKDDSSFLPREAGATSGVRYCRVTVIALQSSLCILFFLSKSVLRAI